ncbi:hypothetical protein TNCV_5088281 [Trichonephila clavipes]|nr:hypothetical protein TNCV_5088281 [Trichonephila clavipes]
MRLQLVRPVRKDSTHGFCLTFSEIATRVKQEISFSWMQNPVHKWYERNRPGAALVGISKWQDETTLAGLRSGHTRAQWHVAGLKVYTPYPNFNAAQTAPAYILPCIDCHKKSSPQVLIQFFIV